MLRTLLWYGIAEVCISVLFDGLTKNLEVRSSPHPRIGAYLVLTLSDGEQVSGWYRGVSEGHVVLKALVPSIGEYATLYFPCCLITGTEVLG